MRLKKKTATLSLCFSAHYGTYLSTRLLRMGTSNPPLEKNKKNQLIVSTSS